MTTSHSTYEIRDTLRREITDALNEVYFSVSIEISEISRDKGYLTKGIFKVIPFLQAIVKRQGKFEAKLDGDLKIINLKITEETSK